jgi:hypothetical protein
LEKKNKTDKSKHLFSKKKKQLKKLRNKFIKFLKTNINYNSNFKRNWDYFIILAVIWSVFIIPLSISFKFRTTVTMIVDFGINLLFIMDMFVNFKTTYLDDNFDEVLNSKKIAVNYLKGRWFVIDLISAVPFDLIGLFAL